jgi:hypothetical protein
MKATEAKLLEFLKKSPQFVIPIYQRTYSWTERECRQLHAPTLRYLAWIAGAITHRAHERDDGGLTFCE